MRTMKLTPAQVAVLVNLITSIRDKTAKSDEPYATTVTELSKKMRATPSNVRSTLNDLSKGGLVKSESAVGALLRAPTLADSLSVREKLWKPTFPVGTQSIRQFIKEHPELLEYLGQDALETILQEKRE